MIWTERSVEGLCRLPVADAKRIKSKVEQYVSQDPMHLGKPLRGDYKGLYRYRLGNYRVIYQIKNDAVEIVVLFVGYRKDVYN